MKDEDAWKLTSTTKPDSHLQFDAEQPFFYARAPTGFSPLPNGTSDVRSDPCTKMKDEDAWKLTSTTKPDSHLQFDAEQPFFYTRAPPGFSPLPNGTSDGSSPLSQSISDGSSPVDFIGILGHLGLDDDRDLTVTANEFCRQCVVDLPSVKSLEDVGPDAFRRPASHRRISGLLYDPTTSSPCSIESHSHSHLPRWHQGTRQPTTHIELMNRSNRTHVQSLEQPTSEWNPFSSPVTGNLEQLRPVWQSQQYFPFQSKSSTWTSWTSMSQPTTTTWSTPHNFLAEQKTELGASNHPCSQRDLVFSQKARPISPMRMELDESSNQWMPHLGCLYGQEPGQTTVGKLDLDGWDQALQSHLLGQTQNTQATSTKAEVDQTWIQSLRFGPKPVAPSSSAEKVDHPDEVAAWGQRFPQEQHQKPAPPFEKQAATLVSDKTDQLAPACQPQEPEAESGPASLFEFSKNWFQSDRAATDYVTHPTSPVQVMHREILFYVSSKQVDTTFSQAKFTINVLGAQKSFANIRVSKDRNKPRSRLICTFWAEQTGLYEVKVFFNETMEHVDGSPFPIQVNPDYASINEEKIFTTAPAVYRTAFTLLSSKLWGVVFNPVTKEVYVADRHGAEILVFSVQNEELAMKRKWSVPSGLQLVDSFHPTGIALDLLHQKIYVTDKGNHCVFVFSTTGDYLMRFGKLGYFDGDFSYPWGIAVSPDGELVVVADSKNHRIQMFNAAGAFLRRFSVFESNPYEFRNLFDQPRGVCFDRSGTRILVTDFNVAKTFQFDLNLTTRTPFGPSTLTIRPQGISMDPVSGTYLICDSRRNLIRQLSPTGELLRTIDRNYNDNFGLEMPVGACFCDGSTCIVDRGGMRIRLIK